VTLKTRSGVTGGHWKRHHSINHIRHTISSYLTLNCDFDIRGSQIYINGPCPPDAPSGKILTHPKYLPIDLPIFQLRSSINMRLTESYLYNSFCIDRSTASMDSGCPICRTPIRTVYTASLGVTCVHLLHRVNNARSGFEELINVRFDYL